MEKDKWKKFIDENRSAFDSESPSPELWRKLERNIDKNQPMMVRLSSVLKIAAVVVLVAASLVWYLFHQPEGNHLARHPVTNFSNESGSSFVLAQLSPEYREMEVFYVSRIQSALSEVDKYPESEELHQSLSELDHEFNLLREEMEQNVNASDIIEAMITNYKMKLDLLEQFLSSCREWDDEMSTQ